MSRLSVLQDYVSSSVQILDVLSKRGVATPEDAVETRAVPDPLLNLSEQGDSDCALRVKLQARSLEQDLVDELCHIYRRRSSIWSAKVQAEWTTLYHRLVRLETATATLSILRDACRANLSRGLHAMQGQITSLLDNRIRDYCMQSEIAASATSSDEFTDTDDENVRGHRAEAVAILEAAYAYTTNITQAEKRRLAQATGLEPRQVVIWFQNRRNRKVKVRVEADAHQPVIKQDSSPRDPPRKRKMSCNDTVGPRRPTSFVTPEKRVRLHDMPQAPIDRRLLSGTSDASQGSSIDSRADSLLGGWAGSEKYGKQRTASSESAATSYTSPSVCSSFGSTPAANHWKPLTSLNAQQASQIPGYSHMRPQSTSFEQEQAFAHHLLGPAASYARRQPPPAEVAHIFDDGQQHFSSSGVWQSSPSNLLFSEDSNTPRLDFDDLGLSLADFGKEVSLPFDFAAPPPAGGAQEWQRGPKVGEGPSGLMRNQDPFAATFTSAPHGMPMHCQAATRPHHVTGVAETLNEGDFDLFAALASLPTFQGMSPEAIVQFAAGGGQDLSFEAEQQSRNAASPSMFGSSSSSTPQEKEVVTPPSKATEANSPEDFAFTFDFAELGLDRTFAEIRQTYRIAEEEAKMYSISEMEDEGCGGASSGWETGPEETQVQQVKRFSSSTIVLESPTSSGLSSGPWAIPTRPVDLHAQRGSRQPGGRVFAS